MAASEAMAATRTSIPQAVHFFEIETANLNLSLGGI